MTIDVEHKPLCGADVRMQLVGVICLPPHGYTSHLTDLLHEACPISYSYSVFVPGVFLKAFRKHKTFNSADASYSAVFAIVIELINPNWHHVIVR